VRRKAIAHCQPVQPVVQSIQFVIEIVVNVIAQKLVLNVHRPTSTAT
jgi:hypothetical protein